MTVPRGTGRQTFHDVCMLKLRSEQGLQALFTTSHFSVKKERLMSDSNFTYQNPADLFYVCQTSPSGLRYRKDIPASGGMTPRIKDEIAGSRRITRSGARWSVYFSNKSFTSHQLVFEIVHGRRPNMAIDHFDGNTENNAIDNLREATALINARNRKRQKRNKSGITGVDRFVFNGYEYWRARWYSNAGKLTNKQFSIKKLGEYGAFDAARAYREAMLIELGEYTARHGVAV